MHDARPIGPNTYRDKIGLKSSKIQSFWSTLVSNYPIDL